MNKRDTIRIFVSVMMIMFISSCKKDNNTEPPATVLPPGSIRIDSFTPGSAPKDSIVTINGANFSSTAAENIVTFNGLPATVVTATATKLEVRVPLHALSGNISVRVGAQLTRSDDLFRYLYTVTTLAGGNFGFANGEGSNAAFNGAFGLTTDAQGNVYVADGGNNMIRKITPLANGKGLVTTLAGDTLLGIINGPAANARFNYPHGLVVDPTGNIYVADAGNNVIRKITPDGTVSTFAGNGTADFINGSGTDAAFNFPADIKIDAAGNLYVSDGSNHCIRKIVPLANGTCVVSTFATGFGVPEGITIDGSTGNMYVADAGSGVVRKVTATGVVSTLAGNGVGDYVDGTGIEARFHNPEGIAMDALGNLYVGDLNAAIRKIIPFADGTAIVSTIAGNGMSGFVEGIGPNARFHEPSGIATDAFGNIYVADVSNFCIRKLQ